MKSKLYYIYLIFITLLIFIILSFQTLKIKPNQFWSISNNKLVNPKTNKKKFYIGIDVVVPPDHSGPAWASTATTEILYYNFDGLGAWADPSIIKLGLLPYGIVLDIYRTYPNVGDLNWEDIIEKNIIKPVVGSRAADHKLIGYWLDNEITLDSAAAYKYFYVINKLIKKYDPNHLNFGIRYNHPPPATLLNISKNFIDVNSFNIYSNDIPSWDAVFKNAYNITKKPIFISEFSFYSDDNTSGCRNTHAYAGKVGNQEERATAFKKTVAHWKSNPIILGCDFFQWRDEPPEGRALDGEDCNYGLKNTSDQNYLIINSIKEMNNK